MKEAVEEHFSCEFELFTEFTGLIRSVPYKTFMKQKLDGRLS